MSRPMPMPTSAPKGPKKIELASIFQISASVGIAVPGGSGDGGIGSSTPMGKGAGGPCR